MEKKVVGGELPQNPPPQNPPPNPNPQPNPTPQPGSGGINLPRDLQTLTYVENPNNVPGVGRGISENTGFKSNDLKDFASKGTQLYRVIVSFPDFRTRNFDGRFLEHYEKFLSQIRNANAMVQILHAAWFNDFGLTGLQAQARGISDSPLRQVLAHIEQLAPIWERNADIINYMPKGFNGCWGEDNKSSNGLGIEDGDRAIPGLREINALMLDILRPLGRMTAIRYAQHHRKIFGGNNLDPAKRFTNDPQANTGMFNDFMFSDYDSSSWAYVGSHTLTSSFGGEGVPNSYNESRARNAVREFEACHWTHMQPSFVSQFRNIGNYDEIMRRLGYRFVLVGAKIPQQIKASENVVLEITVRNEGFASLFNPRPMDLILRNRSSGNVIRLPLGDRTATYDARKFLPLAGETRTILLQALGVAMPQGSYDVLLHLKHDYPNLQNRPQYSVQFCNQNMWEESTGFNRLGSIEVN